MLTLINPIARAEPFDHPEWVFEAKFDGFRAAADTARGCLISRNGNRMQRFEAVLDLLPKGHVFDGELVVLDDAGRPQFEELFFGRACPTYVAFDLLVADGVDLRPLSLRGPPRRRWRGSAHGPRVGLRSPKVLRTRPPNFGRVVSRNDSELGTGAFRGLPASHLGRPKPRH